ncbi:MAG: type IV pili methyl-accepting chemotaxis transducer N-terminal domain-containing protein [Cellvibrionales bacterium]|nr:type IV pili methyl-accepting chemotaxis transducer N-terminal domain-containing protein [Cellvibrionales bacterium]
MTVLTPTLTLITLVFSVLTLTPFAFADKLTLSEIIDQAGQQRMLSQRIAKAYILKGIPKQKEKGEDQLTSAITQFNKNFYNIKKHKSSKALPHELTLVKNQWLIFKDLIDQPNSPENELKVIKQSDFLLKAAHAYVKKLEMITGEELSEVVGTSGKQRMLSQRIARNYLAYHRGLAEEEWLDRVYDDLAEYENTLLYLKTTSVNTRAINTMLRKAHSNFRFINQGFDGILSFSPERLVHVAISSTEMMLYRMDTLTKQYAALETSSDYNSSIASR